MDVINAFDFPGSGPLIKAAHKVAPNIQRLSPTEQVVGVASRVVRRANGRHEVDLVANSMKDYRFMQSGVTSEFIRSSRTGWIAAGLLLAAVSCNEDVATVPQSDAAATAGSSAPKDELREIFAASIEAYDRQVESHCPCFVQNGTYESVDECRKWQKSADDWISCGTEALRPHDSPALRANLACVKERADRNTACNATIACESPERSTCSESLLLCFVQMSDAVLVLDDKCPDFSLLPRERVAE